MYGFYDKVSLCIYIHYNNILCHLNRSVVVTVTILLHTSFASLNNNFSRRLVNEDDTLDNTRMPGTPGDDTSYPFDCLITINPKEDGTAVGEMLAASFTKFTQARKDLFGGRAQEFTLKEVLTGPESNRPMVYYLIDEDVVKLFMTSFYVGKDNSKDTLYNHEVLLESFFGTVSNGQRLLDMYAKW